MSKRDEFILLKVIVPLYIVPSMVYSYAKYYMGGTPEASFVLAFEMKWVNSFYDNNLPSLNKIEQFKPTIPLEIAICLLYRNGRAIYRELLRYISCLLLFLHVSWNERFIENAHIWYHTNTTWIGWKDRKTRKIAKKT